MDVEFCKKSAYDAHGLMAAAGTAVNLLGAKLDDSRLVLDIETEGMALEDKLQFERILKAKLALELGERRLVVNYKRLGALSSGGAALTGSPSVVPKVANPFGLKIEKRAIPGVRNIVMVASGKGGVGKSTVSANLAVALAQQGHRVGLLDADIYGPSAPLMFGLGGAMGVSPDNKLEPSIAHGVKVVSFGFMSDAKNPVIWRGPLISKAIRQFCYDVSWGDLDFLVIDLPPGTGDVQISLIETLPIHSAIVVTTPQDVALIDAHKAVSMFETLGVPLLGLVVNMAFHTCSNCGHDDLIFGQGGENFAKLRKLPVLAQIPLKGRIRADCDAGSPTALDREHLDAPPYYAVADAVLKPLSRNF